MDIGGGRLRGLVSFASEAAVAYGATFDNGLAQHMGWGLYPEADQTRILQAYHDLRRFRSSLHLFAYKIGAWHVRLNGTLTNMSLGWIMHFLFQSLRNIAPFRSLTDNEDFLGSSSSESEMPESPANKKAKNKEPMHQADE